MTAKLLAYGFNAHGQLLPPANSLDKKAWVRSKGKEQTYTYTIPDDITKPTIVASGERTASVLFSGWSDTLLEIDGKLYLRGASANGKQLPLQTPQDLIVKSAFGDHTGLKGVVSDKADVLVLASNPEVLEESYLATSGIKNVSKIAISGNGKVCVIQDLNKILLYTRFEKFVTQQEPEGEWDFSDSASEITELVSNESAFTFLTTSGQVYTFGDPRHNILCRDLKATPSTKPGLVDALDGIPIKKVSSGGWMTAALSREGDLYIWGGRTGDDDLIEGLQGLGDSDVSLVDLGDGLDVVDVAAGGGHLAALTTDGKIWMVGRGENGQVGGEDVKFHKEWEELQGVPDRWRAIGLACGGWGTFIMLKAGQN